MHASSARTMIESGIVDETVGTLAEDWLRTEGIEQWCRARACQHVRRPRPPSWSSPTRTGTASGTGRSRASAPAWSTPSTWSWTTWRWTPHGHSCSMARPPCWRTTWRCGPVAAPSSSAPVAAVGSGSGRGTSNPTRCSPRGRPTSAICSKAAGWERSWGRSPGWPTPPTRLVIRASSPSFSPDSGSGPSCTGGATGANSTTSRPCGAGSLPTGPPSPPATWARGTSPLPTSVLTSTPPSTGSPASSRSWSTRPSPRCSS